MFTVYQPHCGVNFHRWNCINFSSEKLTEEESTMKADHEPPWQILLKFQIQRLHFIPKVSPNGSLTVDFQVVIACFRNAPPLSSSSSSFFSFLNPWGNRGHSAVHSTFPRKHLWGSFFLSDNVITTIISPLSATELYLSWQGGRLCNAMAYHYLLWGTLG